MIVIGIVLGIILVIGLLACALVGMYFGEREMLKSCAKALNMDVYELAHKVNFSTNAL